MIQIYHGDGKGKTTAAVGLAVRAVGSGLPVLFVQFLKDDTSGEIAMLQRLGVETLHAPQMYGFVSRMCEEELAKTRAYFADMLSQVEMWIAKQKKQHDDVRKENTVEAGGCLVVGEAVVVLDEVLHAVKYGLLDESTLMEVLESNQAQIEFVLSGRNPSDKLLALADYVTEMKKEKHPYEQGISARKGIEF